MKIALSTRSFTFPLMGGVDIYSDRLGRALERRGFEVFYLSFNPADDFEGPEIRPVLESFGSRRVWRFCFEKRPNEVFQKGYDPDMGERIHEVLREERPDIFVILNFYLSTLAAVEAAKTLGIPVAHIATDFLPVCRRATMVRWDGQTCQTGESIKSCSACFLSSHTLGRAASNVLNHLPDESLVRLANLKDRHKAYLPLKVLNPYWRQVQLMDQRLDLLSPLRREIDLVFTPTRYTAEVFRKNGFHPDQIQFLHFGVEPENPLASVQHTPAGYTRFLFVGRLQPYKGAHLLIKAFNQLASPKNATLTIYGTKDGYEAYFDELTSLMSSNERIQFRGEIPLDQLGNAFAEADYFILPSTWNENNPLILSDALQSHTPVIASAVGGVTDFVEDGVTGFLFPMGDVDALQAVMQRVIDKPELLEQFRSNAELPSIDEYVDKFLSLCFERGLLPETVAT